MTAPPRPPERARARIETVFIDAGGVLVEPSWQRVSAALARHGVAVSAEALARAEPGVRRSLDVQAIVRTTSDAGRSTRYFDAIVAAAGTARSAGSEAAFAELAAYHARANLWERVLDGVPAALARLRGAGLRLAVVSNANGTVAALLVRLGLSGFFDVVIDSAVVGVEKPDPGIFAIALERMSARPETTIHVGDLESVDVAGAGAAGLRAALIDPLDLHPQAACPRFASLLAFAEHLT